ncbi:T9SS type A sorting domain-containing protein [Aequorivita capsosiphonis]|uniref:T9SS type A sorting domain-containing protein n=1 Tax=Aequorivita capsosiphonis TaxID=487317 RepID=UPI00042536D5|nr:T9SS type A sorting domain-containing protein [Aequorivita capsosiphonis]
MKKITFLLGCLVATLGTVNAQDLQNTTVTDLLNRMDAVENPLGAEPEDLFTPAERLVLQNHFNANNSENPVGSIVAGDVYAASVYGGCERGFGTFPVAGPHNINYITGTTTKFYAGDHDDDGNIYAVSSDTFDENAFLFKIDPETGLETEIGNLNLDVPQVITGIAFNTINQTWYILTGDSTNNRLFTVDVATATITQVGGNMGSRLGIWLAIDNEGNAFTMDIGTDLLYAVDLATAAVTIVGPTGVNLSHAQDADFDPATGMLYAAGYHGGGVNRFYAVDTTTGSFTDTGSINNGCAELGLVAISGDALGVSENSLEGFSYYPNPATNVLNLKSMRNIENVSIYNLLGQQVINSRINATDSQLDVSSLNTGAYIMKVEVNGEMGTYKLIKN